VGRERVAFEPARRREREGDPERFRRNGFPRASASFSFRRGGTSERALVVGGGLAGAKKRD
jgi:hypothetical protein